MYSGTCLIRHTKGPGKCVGLYRMSEDSGFILVNINTLGPYFFVGCHRMSEDSGVGMHKFHYIYLCILYQHEAVLYSSAENKDDILVDFLVYHCFSILQCTMHDIPVQSRIMIYRHNVF